MLNKYNITFIIIIVCFGFIYLDYTWNGYADKYPLTASSTAPIQASVVVEKSKELPDNDELQKLPINSYFPDLKLSAPISAPNLFKIVYAEKENLLIKQYNLGKEGKIAAKIYKIECSSLLDGELYLEIKEKLTNFGSLSGKSSINETNNFGVRSFYFNDQSRKEISFLVVQIKNGIFAFEYPKPNHQIITKIILLIDQK